MTRRVVGNDVDVPDVRTQIVRKAISYQGPKFWNSLPNELKVVSKFASFARQWRELCFGNFENHPT